MKVRLLLLGTVVFALCAALPAGAANLPQGTPTTHLFTLLKHSEEYLHVSGTADYKEFGGGPNNGGSNKLTVTVSAQSLRNLDVYVQVFPSEGSSPTEVCTLHLGAHGNGNCVLDSSLGATVPVIVPLGEVLVSTNSGSTYPDIVEGEFGKS